MPQTSNLLDSWHSKFTQNSYLQILTAFTRCLLAIGFIPPSIPKIRHIHFTTLPDDNPVGHYFNALYATGFYYDFIGWMQLIAGVLLLLPQTAHVGALIFFPIIINIAVLTFSVGFQGTWLITLLMALAGFYLLAWEYDRLKPLVFNIRPARSNILKHEKWFLPLVFALGSIILLLMMIGLGVANLHKVAVVKLIPLIVAGAIFGFIVYWHHLKMKIGRADKPNVE